MRRRALKFIFFTAAAIGILMIQAFGQSGRKKSTPPAPLPVATPPPSSTEIETVPAKISTLFVVGEVTSDSAYFHSNYLDMTAKEFAFWMKYEPRPFLGVTRGGKMKWEDARDASKKETERHVLWIGVSLRTNNNGQLWVDFLDYAILMPRTGRTLLNGRLYPGEQKVLAQGGVMKIPTVSGRGTLNTQMKLAARELAFKLKSTSWF
jgi:hypothetical protein